MREAMVDRLMVEFNPLPSLSFDGAVGLMSFGPLVFRCVGGDA
jgi:hypothetical protein